MRRFHFSFNRSLGHLIVHHQFLIFHQHSFRDGSEMGSVSSRSVESVTDDDDEEEEDEEDDNDDENDDVMEVDLTDGAVDDPKMIQKQKKEKDKRLSIHLGHGDDARSKRERTGKKNVSWHLNPNLNIAVNTGFPFTFRPALRNWILDAKQIFF